MKNISQLSLLIIIIALVITISCKKEDEKAPDQKLKVAMLAQGFTFDDLSFLQSCKTGMEQAKADFGLDVEYNIDTTTDNYQGRIDAFGDQGFDLIIAIGFMLNDAVIAAAKLYPNSKFVFVDAELSDAQSNAISVLFDVDEAAFPLGFLSAWWADSHDNTNPMLGFVGAVDIPQIRQFIEPYGHGAVYYNQMYGKNVGFAGHYAGDFFNEELGKDLAENVIGMGADVMFGVGSLTASGALLKTKELGKVGLATDVDQYYSFPEVSDILLSCAMKELGNSIYAVIKSFVDSNFNGGGIYTGKLSNQGVEIAPYHDFENQIPDSIKLEIEAIKQGIVDGSISTGW